jgi:UDP-GlcNAc3NAcA epimerase
LKAILTALGKLSREYQIVLPLHPRTARYLENYGLSIDGRVKVTEPVSYLTMLALEANARVILTDSGGVQKEAYWLKVPCVTLRDRTEWVETVNEGWNTLAGADSDRICQAVHVALGPKDRPEPVRYGEADAAEKICRIVLDFVQGRHSVSTAQI